MTKQSDCIETIDVRHHTIDPPDWDAFRRVGHRMLDDAIAYLETARERPVWQATPAAVRERLAVPLPLEGEDLAAVYGDFVENVLPFALGSVHPRFWGWVIGSGSPVGVLAEMLAAAMNSNCFGGDQGATWVEEQVLAWSKAIVGFPPEASGLLVSGGSIANLVALTVALRAHAGFDVAGAGVGAAPRPLTLYASAETHASVRKAVAILGLGTQALRAVPVTSSFAIDLAALERMIAADRRAGRQPFCVIANAGTVNTGAIDPLDALADLCAREELWLHVDGAIGAPAVLSPRLAPAFAGMSRADSLIFDFHKWMYVNYAAACVLVRDAEAHRRAFTEPAAYLARSPRGLASEGTPAFGEYGPELSRPFRALKVWMALKAHGARCYADCIEGNVAQARRLAALVAERPELELLAPVPLNIVCFRFVGRARARAEHAVAAADLDGDALDAANAEILMQLQEAGIAVISRTTLHGRLALRVAITNHRSRDEDFDLLIREVVARGTRLVAAHH
jgi:aromatic-L-amino-acid/L-tryptophan decarboxylase